MTLMLPPVPGTDTAHPDFEINDDGLDIALLDGAEWLCITDYPELCAAAIAHYWHEHAESFESCTKQWDDALNQYGHWKNIAAGSRDYDNAEIVAYNES